MKTSIILTFLLLAISFGTSQADDSKMEIMPSTTDSSMQEEEINVPPPAVFQDSDGEGLSDSSDLDE